MRKRVLVRFKGRKNVTFQSVKEAVEHLAKKAKVYYTYPEKSSVTHLERLANAAPDVTSYKILKH